MNRQTPFQIWPRMTNHRLLQSLGVAVFCLCLIGPVSSTWAGGIEPGLDDPQSVTRHSIPLGPTLNDDAGLLWALDLPSLRRVALSPAARIQLAIPRLGKKLLQVRRQSELSDQGAIFTGTVEGIPGSRVVLAIHPEAIAGTLFLPELGSVALTPAPGGTVQIEAVDNQPSVRCGVHSPMDSKSAKIFQRAARLMGNSPRDAGLNSEPPEPVRLDLLILYTPAARAKSGGVASIETLLNAAVAEMNETLENSRVPANVRLVGVREVPYLESGRAENDLEKLTQAMLEPPDSNHEENRDGDEEKDPEDGLSAGPAIRKELKADLVCLVVEGGDQTVGIANQLSQLELRFAPKALSVIQRGYVNRYQILAHELGHNLGCQHERAPDVGPGLFSYSYGYRFQSRGTHYRTVMASAPGIVIPFFSNPEVTFLGIPTGVPSTDLDSANNAQTLSLTTPFVADFDKFWILPPPPLPVVELTKPHGGDVFETGQSLQLQAEVTSNEAVARVEFFVGNQFIGTVSKAPFVLTWTPPKSGNYSFWVQASDARGEANRCAPVTIRVSIPPHVALRLNLLQGYAPWGAKLACEVDAEDPDGQIRLVEYFANNYKIGESKVPPFSLTWTNTWDHHYIMTARATDDAGLRKLSLPVPVSFAPPTPMMELTRVTTSPSLSPTQLEVFGMPGSQCRLETSTDLIAWTLVKELTLGTEPHRTIPPTTESGATYYRLKLDSTKTLRSATQGAIDTR